MSITKIKITGKGECVDFSFRKKRVGKKDFIRSERLYLDKELSKAKKERFIELSHAKFLEKSEEEFRLDNQELNYNITLSEFIDFYLNFLLTNKSKAHYINGVQLSKFIKEKIGSYKLKDLTPLIIQNFFEEVNSIKFLKRTVLPKKAFSKILETHKFKAKEFSIKHNSAHFRNMKRIRNNSEVSYIWAKQLSDYLNLDINELFIVEEKYQDYSYTTKKKYITFLKSCLSEAKRKLLIKENYAKSDYSTFAKNNNPNKELKVLKEEDFLLLYNYVLNLDLSLQKIFMIIILNTGARKEEIFGLKWKNIDFNEQTIEFQNTVVSLTGFGITINEYQTKNSSSNRKIGISNEVLEIIRDYKETLKETNEEEYIFILNNRLLNPRASNRWLNKILEELNLPHITVHSLRHSYASLMINHLPLANLSKRLGHSQISTTLNIYTHQICNKEKIQSVKDILNNNTALNKEIYESLLLLKNSGIITEEEYKNKLKPFM